jgi:hypothetical protein
MDIVERTLTDEWDLFVARGEPSRELPAALAASRGEAITRGVVWAELEDVRLAVAELHAALDDDDARAGLLATSRWSVRDVIGHLAAWAGEFRREIDAVARGDGFDYSITFAPRIGPTAWNEVERERRRDATLDALCREFDAETVRLQDLALSLPDDVLFAVAELPQTPDGATASRWRRRPADLMLMKCWHDRYHIGRLRQLLDLQLED